MNKNTSVIVYQLGFEMPGLVKPLAKRALLKDRLRTLLVPEHALVFDGGIYRGRGQHIPNAVTLALGHDYSTRDIEKDFTYIDAALILLGHSDKEPISINPAQDNGKGLADLTDKFNFYRSMRDVRPDVQWRESA